MIPYCLNMGPSILVITGGHVDGLMVDGCLQLGLVFNHFVLV